MDYYQTKASSIPGTDFHAVHRIARKTYQQIKSATRRRTYIRSAYFRREKVFIDIFWQHLFQKNWRDRVRRLKFYPAALEVIRHSRNHPVTVQNSSRPSEVLHRFGGVTADKQKFIVQIKQDKQSNRKDFVSIYPA